MIIETQISTNENIMHFYPENGLNVKKGGEYSDAKTLRKSPLAEKIFDLGEVEAIIITPDCISVTKKPSTDWQFLKPQILAEIMDFLASGAQIAVEDESLDEEEIVRRVNALIEARIRPAIQKDGGNIELRSYKDGIVYVEMQGKCVGCPHAQQTLKDGVEKLLKTYIPEIKAVEKYEE